jgi:hypothetical protein
VTPSGGTEFYSVAASIIPVIFLALAFEQHSTKGGFFPTILLRLWEDNNHVGWSGSGRGTPLL